MKKKKIIKRINYFMQYLALRGMLLPLRIAPLSFVYWVAKQLGLIAFHILRIRRDASLRHIHQAFGDTYTALEQKEIACNAYINAAITFIELLLAPRFKKNVLEMVDMPDAHLFDEALADGTGFIVATAHFGSWEMVGAAPAVYGVPYTVVGKPQKNKWVTKLINKNREYFGMKVISLGAPMKLIVRAIKNGEAIGLVTDQDAGSKGIFIDFMGRKASTYAGSAHMALKYNTPVFMLMMKRIKTGKYHLIIKNIEMFDDDTVHSLMQRITDEIESVIRECPDQYFWMHKRWRTRPPEEKTSDNQ
jgi:KDO2-lipid IV(A) lauroyltransferase